MKMKQITLAAAATLILAPTIALADGHARNTNAGIQYSGPVEISTVDNLLAETSMFTEKDVVVEGSLVRQIKGSTFIFSDGFGEIKVELDDDIQLTQPLDNTTKVRLYGEYEGGNTPEIEVDHIQIL